MLPEDPSRARPSFGENTKGSLIVKLAALPNHKIRCTKEATSRNARAGGRAERQKLRRKLLLTAGLALLLGISGLTTYSVLKSALAPSGADAVVAQASTPTPTQFVRVLHQRTHDADFQAGVMVWASGNDPNFDFKAAQELDRLAALGVNSVGLVFPIVQTSAQSVDVHADPTKTPSLDRIALFAREAHQRGFTVLLRPLLDERTLATDRQWRGTITPKSVDVWFQAYQNLILGYARLAQRERIDALGVGSELNSLEDYGAQWLQIIGQVRKIYSGLLTYSSTFDHGYPTQFAQSLDFLSVDAYYPLDARDGATVNDLEVAWRHGRGELEKVHATSGKPVTVTEIGTASRTGSYRTPWTLQPGASLDLETQRRYYQASCGALSGVVSGLYWWYATLDASSAPASDAGYNPMGKPAELEIAKCYGSK